MITKPMLPPKKGYVEVEADGKRTYRNVDTGILIDDEISIPTMDERVTVLEGQLAHTNEQLAQTDETLIEIYEMIGA